jgi:hypothetical protein
MRLSLLPAVHFADPQGFLRQTVRLSAATLLHLQSQVLPVSARHFENDCQRGESAGPAQDTRTAPWGSVAALESSGLCDLSGADPLVRGRRLRRLGEETKKPEERVQGVRPT